MNAIWEHYGHQNMIVKGALASVDSFLVCHSAGAAHEMIDALVEAVVSGEVPMSAIEASGRRLDRLARDFVRPAATPDLAVLGSAAHRELARRLGSASGDRPSGLDPTEVLPPERTEPSTE
jgi:hypothetical protein